MTKKLILIFLLLILNSCGTNRKVVGDEDTAETPIEDIRRDIASAKEPEVERDPLNPSLWTGKGTDSYLFSNISEKKLGDIILVDVYSKLRKEIGAELTLDAVAAGYQGPEEEKEAKTAPPEESGKDDTPSDHISTVIEEEVNNTHVLLKGRKAVVYKGNKKLIEFKGLVARKDIQGNDRVNSKNVLESTIRVLR